MSLISEVPFFWFAFQFVQIIYMSSVHGVSRNIFSSRKMSEGIQHMIWDFSASPKPRLCDRTLEVSDGNDLGSGLDEIET